MFVPSPISSKECCVMPEDNQHQHHSSTTQPTIISAHTYICIQLYIFANQFNNCINNVKTSSLRVFRVSITLYLSFRLYIQTIHHVPFCAPKVREDTRLCFIRIVFFHFLIFHEIKLSNTFRIPC